MAGTAAFAKSFTAEFAASLRYCSTIVVRREGFAWRILAPKVTWTIWKRVSYGCEAARGSLQLQSRLYDFARSGLPAPIVDCERASSHRISDARMIQVRHRSYATFSRQPRQVRKEATVTGSCVCSEFPVPDLFSYYVVPALPTTRDLPTFYHSFRKKRLFRASRE